MEIIYSSDKTELQCTNLRAAKKLFGGDERLALKLLAINNALQQAPTIKDIIVLPSFHFHKLKDKGRSKLKGYYAIDIGGRKQPWRIILQPLNDDMKPFVPCNIDQIAGITKIIEIMEVSNHYE